jgi:hypothetical protein
LEAGLVVEKFIGSTVDIIYIDRNKEVSFRTVLIKSVRAGIVKAHCFTANAPRTFIEKNIIDVEPIKHVG